MTILRRNPCGIANLPELRNLPVSLEVNLSESLFHRLQALLEVNPKESMASPPLCGIDSLFARAVAAYLDNTTEP